MNDPNYWQVEALKLVPNVLSASSCWHVALLVFLRLLAVTKPLEYEDMHKKLRYISLLIIWLLSICVCLLPLLSLIVKSAGLYKFSRILVLHGLHTIPLIVIAILYVKFFYEIHKSAASTNQQLQRLSQGVNMRTSKLNEMAKSRQMKMMKGVVICLVVCYVPYLVWWEYNSSVVGKRRPYYTSEVLLYYKLETKYLVSNIFRKN